MTPLATQKRARVAETTAGGAGQPPAAPADPKFDALSAQADAARQAGRLDEAVDLYRKALAVKPDWREGLWSLGTMLYELDRFGEARDAFRRVLASTRRTAPRGRSWACASTG